jgi:hypothetical protein
MERQFASQADLADKKISFVNLGEGAYAYTAYDEATRYPDPRIWTAQRDKEMWQALEG